MFLVFLQIKLEYDKKQKFCSTIPHRVKSKLYDIFQISLLIKLFTIII